MTATAPPPVSRPSRLGARLPAFYCPLARDLVHPDAKELETRAVAWLDGFGLYPDPVERAWGLATHSADFSCRIIPEGDPEALLLFIEWNYWANAVDDWQDSGAGEVRTAAVAEHGVRLLRTIENPDAAVLPDGPMTRALADLVHRTHALLTPSSCAGSSRGPGTGCSGRPGRRPGRRPGACPG